MKTKSKLRENLAYELKDYLERHRDTEEALGAILSAFSDELDELEGKVVTRVDLDSIVQFLPLDAIKEMRENVRIEVLYFNIASKFSLERFSYE